MIWFYTVCLVHYESISTPYFRLNPIIKAFSIYVPFKGVCRVYSFINIDVADIIQTARQTNSVYVVAALQISNKNNNIHKK